VTVAVAHDAQRELAELRAYLGPDFDDALLRGHERAMMDELERADTEAELYRTSTAYLYDLTVFAMSGTKRPYVEMLTGAVEPGARILDFGCGIGSDGLALIEAGYHVAFADFDNPSVAYLRWRLERRGLTAPVYDIDRDEVPSGFDLAYSFDVIEHVPDPFGFLETLEGLADRVLVNFLEPEPDDTTLHHELPVKALLRHSAARRLRRYERLHERSHVVLYESARGNVVQRLRGRLAVLRA
jgi:SAM-dependent methyltransferase